MQGQGLGTSLEGRASGSQVLEAGKLGAWAVWGRGAGLPRLGPGRRPVLGAGLYVAIGARWLGGAHQQQTATQRGRRVGLGADPDALQDQSVLPRQPHVHPHGAGPSTPRTSRGLTAVRRGPGPCQAEPERQQGQQQQQRRRRRRRRWQRRPQRRAGGGAHGRTQQADKAGAPGVLGTGEAEGGTPRPDGAGRRDGAGLWPDGAGRREEGWAFGGLGAQTRPRAPPRGCGELGRRRLRRPQQSGAQVTVAEAGNQREGVHRLLDCQKPRQDRGEQERQLGGATCVEGMARGDQGWRKAGTRDV